MTPTHCADGSAHEWVRQDDSYPCSTCGRLIWQWCAVSECCGVCCGVEEAIESDDDSGAQGAGSGARCDDEDEAWRRQVLARAMAAMEVATRAASSLMCTLLPHSLTCLLTHWLRTGVLTRSLHMQSLRFRYSCITHITREFRHSHMHHSLTHLVSYSRPHTCTHALTHYSLNRAISLFKSPCDWRWCRRRLKSKIEIPSSSPAPWRCPLQRAQKLPLQKSLLRCC